MNVLCTTEQYYVCEGKAGLLGPVTSQDCQLGSHIWPATSISFHAHENFLQLHVVEQHQMNLGSTFLSVFSYSQHTCNRFRCVNPQLEMALLKLYNLFQHVLGEHALLSPNSLELTPSPPLNITFQTSHFLSVCHFKT